MLPFASDFLALTVSEAHTSTIVFLAFAVVGCLYAGVAWMLARQHMPPGVWYMPFASETEIPARARFWRNQGYVGAAVFLAGCALSVLTERFL